MTRTPKLEPNGGFAKPSDSFCWRLKDDLFGTCACRPSFRAVDGTRSIDIPASFSPRGWFPFVGKLSGIGIAAFTIYLGVGEDPRAFWLAYLTNWNVTISSFYMVMSLINSIFPVSGPPPGQTAVNFRVKLTWILFTISANIGILVVIAFWTLLWDGVMDMETIFPHGILTAFVLLDGFMLDSIPIRLRHYLEVLVPFAGAYVLWSYIHSLTAIGNPDYQDNDPATNDDLIYSILDWDNHPKTTALIIVVMVLVLSPILQIILWMVSGCRRRYVDEYDTSSQYMEMTGTSANV